MAPSHAQQQGGQTKTDVVQTQVKNGKPVKNQQQKTGSLGPIRQLAQPPTLLNSVEESMIQELAQKVVMDQLKPLLKERIKKLTNETTIAGWNRLTLFPTFSQFLLQLLRGPKQDIEIFEANLIQALGERDAKNLPTGSAAQLVEEFLHEESESEKADEEEAASADQASSGNKPISKKSAKSSKGKKSKKAPQPQPREDDNFDFEAYGNDLRQQRQASAMGFVEDKLASYACLLTAFTMLHNMISEEQQNTYTLPVMNKIQQAMIRLKTFDARRFGQLSRDDFESLQAQAAIFVFAIGRIESHVRKVCVELNPPDTEERMKKRRELYSKIGAALVTKKLYSVVCRESDTNYDGNDEVSRSFRILYGAFLEK